MTLTFPEILSYHEDWYLYYLLIGITISWILQYFEMMYRKTLTKEDLRRRVDSDAMTMMGFAVIIGICSFIPFIQYLILGLMGLIILILVAFGVAMLPTVILDVIRNTSDKE